MNWFLCDRDLRHERVNSEEGLEVNKVYPLLQLIFIFLVEFINDQLMMMGSFWQSVIYTTNSLKTISFTIPMILYLDSRVVLVWRRHSCNQNLMFLIIIVSREELLIWLKKRRDWGYYVSWSPKLIGLLLIEELLKLNLQNVFKKVTSLEAATVGVL